jgi:8-oxo-dGTP pyrophosphatase MutT (NUDIX family)
MTPLALDAATVIIARDSTPSGNGISVLLIERHPSSRAAAGAYVFPGGRIEPEDSTPDIEALCSGLSREEAALIMGDEAGRDRALGFWVGAIREVFEEVSLLYACAPDGALVRLTGERPFGTVRSFEQLIQAEGLRLALDRLHYFAYWITPEERSLRFSTRFFVAEAPRDQDVHLDTREATNFRWIGPEEALAEHRRGGLPLHFPTIRILETLRGLASVEALIASTKGRKIEPIRPRLVGEEGKERILLPGDPNYF